MKTVGWKDIFSINKILSVLVLSDILILSGFGLMSPIFAVFVSEQISGGNLIVVGVAGSIYLAVKSILQIPIGRLIDKISGEKIDFWLALVGNILMTISVFLYIFASLPVHVYLIEALSGIGAAISYPAWMGLFTRNMETGRESFVWSVHSTFVELSSAATAALGGVIATKLGFESVFLSVFILGVLGTITLSLIYPHIKKE